MFYVLDENNNRIEAYSKEEVLAMLNKAIADGSLEGITADAAFISKIKCCVTGGTNNVAFITSAKYNELEAAGTLKEDTAYFITDDTTLDGLDEQLKALNRSITQLGSGLNAITNGTTAVGKTNGINGTVVYEGAASFSNTISDTYPNRNIGVKLEVGYRYLFITPDPLNGNTKLMLEGIAYSYDTYIGLELMGNLQSNIFISHIYESNNTDNLQLGSLRSFAFIGNETSVIDKHFTSIKVIRLEKVFE